MYMCKDGWIVYETLDELLKEDIYWMTELGDFYYVVLTKEASDDTVWKVNKQTEKAEYTQYPAYVAFVEEKATRIDPSTLRRVS